MEKLRLTEVPLRHKRVLVRVDFNVPLDENGNIVDDTRIRSTLPTINFLLDEDAKVIIASHLGRPKGKVVPELSLKPVARRLKRLLDKEVILANDCVGEEVEELVEGMRHGEVLMLENLRFNEGEEKNDPEFAKDLARLADVLVQDAFGNCHRTHASMVGINSFIPLAVEGFLIKKELDYFEKAVTNPMRPVVAMLGGAKVSDKIHVIENLEKKVDKIIIGGAMAFTFLKARGYDVGKSLVEDSMIDEVSGLVDKIRKTDTKLYLPVDFVVAESYNDTAETKVVTFQEIPHNWIALDIGPASTRLFSEALQNAKTVLWNGPMGAFEIDAFSRGTSAMVETIANSHALTIIGGGDTDLAFSRAGESHNVSFISTGGGAFLKLLEGKELPGIAALTDRQQ